MQLQFKNMNKNTSFNRGTNKRFKDIYSSIKYQQSVCFCACVQTDLSACECVHVIGGFSVCVKQGQETDSTGIVWIKACQLNPTISHRLPWRGQYYPGPPDS